ncbi:hypothetical protein BVC80_991g1 [Macleaya cordata]|uniref:Uncharacterized protein n=1 Tax=Macleaya cordata TaxID=56857 RepID=A0A200PXR6_MACCD|nr:hypothetical protein BVC80_991g1 [Macleaya cordata]
MVISSIMNRGTEGRTWDLQFSRRLWDVKILEVSSLIELLNDFQFSNDLHDSRKWNGNSTGMLTVKNAYLKLHPTANDPTVMTKI